MMVNCKQIKILAGSMVLLVMASCNQTETKVSIKKPSADTVKVFLLKLDSAQKTISIPGDLLPNENVQIRAKVQGYISKVKADIGSRVSKGQVLALIEAPEINTHVQELIAKEKATQSRYMASKDYYERISKASKTDGVIAPLELDKSKNQMMADEAESKAAQYAVASYKQIGEYLAIIAPFSGIVTKRNIETGSYVGNNSDKPLFELEDNKTFRLRVPVPELFINAVLAR